MKYDTNERGWRTILKDYSADILEKFIFEWRLEGEPFEMSSRDTFEYENDLLKEQGRTISRASIVFALNEMVTMGLLTYRETTGKGGHRKIYSLAMTPREIELFVVTNVLQRVKDTWPSSFKEVLHAVQ